MNEDELFDFMVDTYVQHKNGELSEEHFNKMNEVGWFSQN